MTDQDLDDLYWKALGAVKKHWEQKYVMSEEETKAFMQQINFEPSMSFSQHEIGNIDFYLPNRNMN